MKYTFFIFIPAKGNCYNIQRKYLRYINGKPLILYSIELAKKLTGNESIAIITDDEEIDLIAKRASLRTVMIKDAKQFPNRFSGKHLIETLLKTETIIFKRFDYVIWMGASSPMIKTRDVIEATQLLENSSNDSVFSASGETQRGWMYDKTYQPGFVEIPNTMMAGVMHKETGAFFIMKRSAIDESGYIGQKATPFILHETRAVEIHSFNDFWVAEKLLQRRLILFVVAGYSEIGMGHVYRALMLAQEFHDHEVLFLCTYQSQLAYNYISEHLYPVIMQKQNEYLEEVVLRLSPDIVINDILDTSKDYILSLKQEGIRTINFEDQGEGSAYSDLVINALYEDAVSPNMLSGYEYFCLRSEFLTVSPKHLKGKVDNVLITFGGTDNNNLTWRILKILLPLSLDYDFKICIVNGPGFAHRDSLKKFLFALSERDRRRVSWSEDGTRQISEYMIESDFAVTSAGRTVHELAALKVPTIVIAANVREQMHTFAIKAGMCFLGMHDDISDASIKNEVLSLITDSSKRKRIKDSLNKYDLTQGKKEVVGKILDILSINDRQEKQAEKEPLSVTTSLYRCGYVDS
ncbi:MAG: hypothetical protein NTV58_17445 [Deltaproteobacteria bacterium]|nr:hypothetical protein [Deltaproteobacteria bacterium]